MTTQSSFDWDLIGEIARPLGVRDKTLEKWRWRGAVPHKWRLPIIRASDGRLSLDAFDRESTSEGASA